MAPPTTTTASTMEARDLLERARAWDPTDQASLLKLFADMSATYKGQPFFYAPLKALLAHSDKLPLRCRAQFHYWIQDLDHYPGSRARHLHIERDAVRDPNFFSETREIWQLEDDSAITELVECIEGSFEIEMSMIARRKPGVANRIFLGREKTNSEHLHQAYISFAQYKAAADIGKKSEFLKATCMLVDKHEDELPPCDNPKVRDSGFKAFRAQVLGALNYHQVTSPDRTEISPPTAKRARKDSGLLHPQPEIPPACMVSTPDLSMGSSPARAKASRSVTFPAGSPVVETRFYKVDSGWESDEDELVPAPLSPRPRLDESSTKEKPRGETTGGNREPREHQESNTNQQPALEERSPSGTLPILATQKPDLTAIQDPDQRCVEDQETSEDQQHPLEKPEDRSSTLITVQRSSLPSTLAEEPSADHESEDSLEAGTFDAAKDEKGRTIVLVEPGMMAIASAPTLRILASKLSLVEQLELAANTAGAAPLTRASLEPEDSYIIVASPEPANTFEISFASRTNTCTKLRNESEQLPWDLYPTGQWW